MLFWTNEFYERGSEIATFDYATHWEKLVCGEAFIAGFSDREPDAYKALAKFQAAFPGRVHLVADGSSALDALAAQLQVDAIYSIQPNCAGSTWPNFRPLYTHAVFHGGPGVAQGGRGSCATVSEACSRDAGVPTIHHMILPDPALEAPVDPLPLPPETPRGGRVFCRHGGWKMFDVVEAREAMCEHANTHPLDVFILLNTEPAECERHVKRPAAFIHFPATTDIAFKRRFHAACNACLHGHYGGETFGLAVAECAAAGLPVITQVINFDAADSFTPLLLGPWGKYYNRSSASVLQQLQSLDPVAEAGRAAEYRALVRGFHPLPVMREFLDRFTTDHGMNGTVSLFQRMLAIQNPRGVKLEPESCSAMAGLHTSAWTLASASPLPSPL